MGNYKMNNIKFLTLLFLLLTTDIFGQGENYVIFQTSNSNIPSNNITAITQDVIGTYWICFSQDVTETLEVLQNMMVLIGKLLTLKL